ncbi:MAG TPA: Asd/ArgC dimerization domain-containing protein, partial [Thermoanaerobaculia bacterium]|nr:Asd/ArgC dimerization domain-containing protein [Thermoanaerobaculia bacterium]
LRETLEARPALAGAEIRLFSDDPEEIGALTEAAGGAALVQPWEPGALDGVDAAFFCGPAAATRRLLAQRPAGVTAVVLSLDAGPEDGRSVVAGVNSAAAERGAPLLSPHPAAILLAHVLWPLRGVGVEEAVATLVQPASMRGQPGLEEMFDQARQIVAMTARTPSPVFGHQLAFNLLPHPGPLEPVAAELREVLRGEPLVSLNVVQGGVFHSFSASLFVRAPGDPGPKALRRALAEHPYVELADEPRHLGPIEAPGSDKVVVGAIRRETGGAGGYWLWAVMDNLTRGGAVNAVEIAEAAIG